MVFFDCGGVRLYFGKPESDAFRSSPVMYYRMLLSTYLSAGFR